MKLSAIKLPLFLFLGQPEAGKSCLIKAINPILQEEKIALHDTLPPCTVYMAKHAAYLKIPGDYLVLLSLDKQMLFFRLLKKKLPCLKQPSLFRYLVTVLDIDDMLKRSNTSNRKHLDQLTQLVNVIVKTFRRPFKLQCLLNKADLIPGFIEYFGFRDKEFKEQIWGFSLTKPAESSLINAFNALIQRLNQQVFWCLQQADTPEKRYAIKGFPVRMEEAKLILTPLLAYFFQTLTSLPSLSLEKLCFVSCRQYTYIEGNRHQYTLVNTAHFKEKHRNFFLKQCFKQMIMDHTPQPARFSRLWYKGFLGLSIAAIAAFTLYLSQQFSSTLLTLEQQKTQWQTLIEHTQDFDHAKKTLSAMDTFISALEKQDHETRPFNPTPAFITYAKNSREHFLSSVWEPELAKHKAWFASLSPETRASFLLKTHIAQYPLLPLSISSAYTAEAFHQINDTIIPQLAQEALPTGEDPTSLIEHLRKTYHNNYAQAWEDFMMHAPLPATPDAKTLGQQLTLFASPTSPILTLLNQVEENTHLPDIETASSYLQNINQILSTTGSPEDNPLYQSFMAMRTLASQCDQTDPEAFSRLVASLKHENPLRSASEHLPHPLNDWMLSLADQYSREIAEQAGRYVNTHWQTHILTAFNNNFSAHYPFVKDAKTSVDLAAFNAFFKKNGLLDEFENKDLLPLLTQTDHGWAVNLRIAPWLQVPHQVIEQLRSFAQLQATYFGEKETLAYAGFSAYVSKKPQTIKAVHIKIGNALFKLTTSEKIANAFSWPSSIDDLQLVIVGNHSQTETFTGPWAWVKLIDKYTVKRDKNRVLLRIPTDQRDQNVEITLLLAHADALNSALFSVDAMPEKVFITDLAENS